MLAGLGPNTVLARMVSIRTEEDEEMLKHFTPEQRRIRCEWRNRTAAKVSIKDRDVFLEFRMLLAVAFSLNARHGTVEKNLKLK